MLLKDFSPNLEKYWSEKNSVGFHEVSKGSRYSPIWVCELNHEWVSRLSNIVKSPKDKVNCPFCSNRKVLPGFNDVATTDPGLMEEWDWDKNTIEPTEVTVGSVSKVHWKCKLNHEWVASLVNRKNGTGCPMCYLNMRESKKPEPVTRVSKPLPLSLVEEWHPVKNSFGPEHVTQGSGVKVWWLGSCGHEWEAKPNHRVIYRTGCPYCSGLKVLPGFNDFAVTKPELVKEWHLGKNEGVSPNEVTAGSSRRVWWVCKENHEWESTIFNRSQGRGCPVCVGSSPERVLFGYVSALPVGEVLRNDRKTLNSFELDVFVPEKQIAVEFNGVYWHDENHKPRNYHYDKWLACKDKDIQLIQVWEDDWNRKPDLIKQMLTHKLKASDEVILAARKTLIVELTQEQANLFLNQNHIQGTVGGGIRFGLVGRDNPNIVLAVMVLKNEPGSHGNTLNLLRFATSVPVVGGFTKILKHVEKVYSPNSIVTFSDNAVSDGALYENTGFESVKFLPPDYMYVVKGQRVHKFNYRLKRFREDPELQYEEGLSERDLAILNKLPRIWDAGKTKWVKSY